MFHVEVNLIYICYLVNIVFLMRSSGDQPDVPRGPRGEMFAHPWSITNVDHNQFDAPLLFKIMYTRSQCTAFKIHMMIGVYYFKW